MLWAKIEADHVKLVPSCDISTLFRTVHLALHLFSDPRLYDHVVTSYVATIMFLWTDMDLWKLRLRKFTFTEKLDFLWKFNIMKIWSHTVFDSFVICNDLNYDAIF